MTQKSNSNGNIKFLYRYGGRIIPRPIDGELRYVGGYTRVLSVDRSISFSELIVKLCESCGFSVVMKCKLPNEDLDVLVSIKSDEELQNVIQMYERSSPESKIRVVLFQINSTKKASQPSSPLSCFDFPSSGKTHRAHAAPFAPCYYTAPPCAAVHRCCAPVVGYSVGSNRKHCLSEGRSAGRFYHVPHRNPCH